LAATRTQKQSPVTFKAFVLWLCNQHYYTHGNKMTYRDLSYYEGMRAKTCCEYKLHENKHENHANPFHTFIENGPYLDPGSFYPFLINIG